MGGCFVEEWRDVLGSLGLTAEALRGLLQELVPGEEKEQDKTGDDVDEYSLFLLEQSLLLSAVAMEAPVRGGSVGTSDSVDYLERLKVFTDELYAVCWDRLHSGQWLSVSDVWRNLFAVACLLSSALLGCCCLNGRSSSDCASDNTTREFYLEKAIFVADMGLILGGNETPVSPYLHSLIRHLLSHYPTTSLIPADLPLRLGTQQHLIIEDTPPIRHPIFELGELSLENFICDYFAKNKSVVIRGTRQDPHNRHKHRLGI
eukprot:GHVS01097605.1.p1 GENE.GHVS01097605.1~~GHVS01097605.1.p1  ORF type:complete len:260 (+),score=41.79 GHVS01097605.1:118-897(+)